MNEEQENLTTSEKLEYETCTSLIRHYETLRMGIMRFFALFNGALLGFLTLVYERIGGGNGIAIALIGLFACIVCLVILNGEIREMSYWTVYIMRARKIEEEINSRNTYTDNESGRGFMDTYRATYREIVKAKDFLERPENGYGKPQNASVIWDGLLFRIAGGSRRSAMPIFYAVTAGGWLLFSLYGVCLLGNVLLRIFGMIIVLTVISLYVRSINSGIKKRDLNYLGNVI